MQELLRVAVYFVRKYPRENLVVLVCLLMAAPLEGISLAALVPLISRAVGSDGAEPSSLELGIDAAVRSVGFEPTLGLLLGLFLGAAWLRAGTLLISKRQVGYAVAQVATDLRLAMLRALLGARWSYFTRQPAGAVANAIAGEAGRAAQSYYNMTLVVASGIAALVNIGVAVAVSWRATLVAVAAALLVLSMLTVFVRIAARAGRKKTDLFKVLLTRLTDALQSIKRIKASGREQTLADFLERGTERINRQERRRVLAKEALNALQEPLVFTLMAVGLVVALNVFEMRFASIAVLGLLFTRTLSKLGGVQRKAGSVLEDSSALWSLLDRIERALAQPEPTGTRAPQLEKSIELRNLSLRYDEQVVLDGVDLELPTGQITALVGPSGAGKTTLVDLVIGLIEPDEGSVLIDGVPLEELDHGAWRRMIGYVPQETVLLHDSIRVNVTLGDESLDDAEIERALRAAHAWDFVSKLPEGIDTVVGERGSAFSGGERQRIALAAALVHRPRLLVLDEATAALDAESEAAVWSAVERLRGQMTILAVSHQPALLEIAERVYRVEGGKLIPSHPRGSSR